MIRGVVRIFTGVLQSGARVNTEIHRVSFFILCKNVSKS